MHKKPNDDLTKIIAGVTHNENSFSVKIPELVKIEGQKIIPN